MELSMPRQPEYFNASIGYMQPQQVGFMQAPHMPMPPKDSFGVQVASSTDQSSVEEDVDSPPYPWSKLAGMRAFQIAGAFWAILFVFFWIIIAIAAQRAQHCVYINGVCFDR